MWTQQEHLQSRRWGLRVKRRAGNTNMNSCFAIKKTDDTNFTPIWKRLVITKTFFLSIWIYYLIFTFELSYFQRISHWKTLPNIFGLELLKEHISVLSKLQSLLKKKKKKVAQAEGAEVPKAHSDPKRGKVVLSLKMKTHHPRLWDLEGERTGTTMKRTVIHHISVIRASDGITTQVPDLSFQAYILTWQEELVSSCIVLLMELSFT